MWRLPFTFRLWRRYSSAVRTELVKVCAALTALLFLAAAQDLSPVVFGAKPPFLLMFGCLAGVPAAIGAGLFTDALSGLPFGCSAVFFFASALAVRFLKMFALLTVAVSAALYQIWLSVWGGNVSLQSSYTALAFALILYPVACKALRSAKRYAGIDKNVGASAK